MRIGRLTNKVIGIILTFMILGPSLLLPIHRLGALPYTDYAFTTVNAPAIVTPASAPIHISPSNGATNVPTTPNFSWQGVSGATKYGLFISKPPYGSGNLVFNSTTDYGPITGTSFTPPITLQEGVRYCWNMCAGNDAGWGPYSSSWCFTTVVSQPVTTVSATVNSYSPSSKIEVDPGQAFTLGVNFTNTGTAAWDYLAGVSVWDASGNLVIDEWSSTIRVQAGQQGSYGWTKSISTSGEYWVQFGVWKDGSTLLDKGPSPSKNLIMVRQPAR